MSGRHRGGFRLRKKVFRTTHAGEMAPPAFWVWHRSSALKPAESKSLRAAGVRKLYWQAAECGWKDGRWQVTEDSQPAAHVGNLEIIPVFRLKPESAFLGSPGAAEALAEQVRSWSGTAEIPVEIQIDFDCPARLLDRYAKFLGELGGPLGPIRELDSRDEATHALEAAESKDPSIAAPALELANQCLFRRAEFSFDQKSRALETDDSALLKSVHQRLVGGFPKSEEAKRAVWFSFSPLAAPWMPGDYNPSNSASALLGAIYANLPREIEGDPGDDGDQIEAILGRFKKIAPKTPLHQIRRDINTAIRDLEPIRARADPENASDVLAAICRLDMLRAAAALRGIGTPDFIAFAADEMDSLPAPFKSLLDYQDRITSVTDSNGNVCGLNNDRIEGWREFLETYPDSPMAESASFRMTRLMARQYRSSRSITAIRFPEAPIPNGYKHLEVLRADAANDPQAVLEAIRDHEKRFPMGRYQDDLNLLRAGALIDRDDFPDALAILCHILDNPLQRDIHMIAALEFSDIAQRLLNPENRIAVAKAMRRTPGAMKRLKGLVNGDTFLSRLAPLMPWMEG